MRTDTFEHLQGLCAGKGIVCERRGKKIDMTTPDGGNGVMLTVGVPMRGFIDGAKYRGPFCHYPYPPKACKQKEVD